jgi:hypothetical protein
MVIWGIGFAARGDRKEDKMTRLSDLTGAAQRAVEQTATAAVVISLRGAIVVALSFALLVLRMWRRF